MLSITLRLNFCYLKIIYILHPRNHRKITGHVLKNKPKNKCVCIHEIIRLIRTRMKMRIKPTPHSYNINRARPSHGHKYSKYKKCLSMMMLIKQHLSNIWSSIYEKLRNTEAGLKKKALLIKKRASRNAKTFKRVLRKREAECIFEANICSGKQKLQGFWYLKCIWFDKERKPIKETYILFQLSQFFLYFMTEECVLFS